MKKLLLVILLIAVGLGISSCKRTKIADPPVDGSTSYNVVLEGSMTISITAPAPNAFVSGTTVSISAVAFANSGIVQVDCYIDNFIIGTLPASTANTYMFSWDSSLYENGSHAIKVTAYDNLGASVSDTINVTLNSEDEPPVVAIIYPSDGENIILPAGSAINIVVNATDNKAISQVDFYVNGILVKANMNASAPLFKYNWTPPADGPYKLYVIAYDNLNQATKSAEVNVTINGHVTVSITAPAPNATVSGTNVTIGALAISDNGISRVDCYIDNSIIGTLSPGTNNTYTLTWNSSLVANGSHAIKVTAVDTKGLSASATINVTVNNQGTGPVVNITAPAPNAMVSGTVAITALATADYGIDKVECSIDNQLIDSKPGSTTSNSYSFSWNAAQYGNGVHTIKVTAYDKNGVSTSASINVTVNNTDSPPEAEIIYPSDDSTIILPAGTAVTIKTNATDDKGISRVSFYVNEILVQANMTTMPDNLYEYDWMPPADGPYTLYVIAYDTLNQATKSAEVSVTVNINNGGIPVVNITSPGNGATVSGTVAITALATADYGIDKVNCSIDNQLIDSKPGSATSNSYSFSWNATQYGNGVHTIKVTAFDKKVPSQTGVATITVSVNNTDAAPKAAIIYPTNGSTIILNLNTAITIKANATDDKGISRVSFYVNGILKQANMTTKPDDLYEYGWLPPQQDGTYTLYVIAYDTLNQATQSATVSVTVNINKGALPVVNITSPGNLATVSGTVTITALATADFGIDKVECYVGTQLIDSKAGSTTSDSYSFSWDTKLFVNGPYTIKVKAYDKKVPFQSTEASITVTVTNI